MTMSRKETPALEITALRKAFGKAVAVDSISMAIEPGEIFGLLGPNGAGKSTTINLATGVARMDSGSVRVFGYDVEKEAATTRRLVGVMHQEVVQDPFFGVGRALKIQSGYYGLKDDPEWRNLLIDRLELREHLKKSIHKLSGGMKRRLMLAKALIHKPKLLILDEPTAGVDVELRRTIWEFIREINSQGTTVLLTTHYLEEAEQMCERIAIMDHGKVIALDQKSNLLRMLDDRKILIQFSKKLQRLPEPLQKFKYEHEAHSEEVSFVLSREESIDELLRQIQLADLRIVGLETVQLGLEEVFLRLTSKNHLKREEKRETLH